MTVCVALTVLDGLVLATDSATTSSIIRPNGQVDVQNVFRQGNKLFNLYKGLPIAAMTCGMGHIDGDAIHVLAKEFRRALCTRRTPFFLNPDNYTIEEVAVKARTFLFDDRFAKLQPPPMGFFEFMVGGFSSDARRAELWTIKIINGVCAPPVQLQSPGETGINWTGQIEPVQRLLIGIDDQSVRQALTKLGMQPAQLNTVMGVVQSHTTRPILDQAMPLGDGIDLVDYLVDVTKGYYRFLPGADIVGGDTDIATVSRHEGFRWIRRKHYYPAHLNPLETGHA